jgi:hypothetical protein
MAEKIEFDLAVLKDTLNSALDKATNKASTLSDTLKVAAGVFAGNVATKAFDVLSGAVSGSVDSLKESIKAASESDEAFRRLELSLSQTGQLTTKITSDIRAFAEEIQRTTVFEDDAVVSSAALIQTLGKLDKEALIPATKAAIELSSALGIDLESASVLVGKAANGNITALQRQGVEIQKGVTDAETFANTLKTIERFSGSAESASKSYAGSLQQLKNAYGELQEGTGKIITQSGTLAGVLNSLKNVIDGVAQSEPIINENDIRNATIVVIELAKVVTDASNGIFRVLNATFNSFSFAIFKAAEVLTGAILAPFKALESVASALDLGGLFEAPIKQLESTVNSFSKQAKTDLNQVVDAFDLTKGNVFDKTVNGLNSIKQNIIQISAEASAAAPNLKNALGVNQNETVDQDILNRRQQLNAELLALDNAYILQANELDLQNQIAQDERFFARTAEQLGQVSSFEQSKIDLELQAAINKNKLIADTEERGLANRKAQREADIKSATVAAKLKGDLLKQEIQNQQTFFSTAKSLASSENKSLAAIGKAAALGEIAIRTPQAVASSFAYGTRLGGPPLGFTFGAIAATAMAAQAAQVAGLKGYAQGGIIGQGATMGGDNRLATVRDGEMVLNAQQQAVVFNAINSGNLGGGDIVINVDGRTIARVVRDQVRSGFSLT